MTSSNGCIKQLLYCSSMTPFFNFTTDGIASYSTNQNSKVYVLIGSSVINPHIPLHYIGVPVKTEK